MQDGISTWSKEDLMRHQAKRADDEIRRLQLESEKQDGVVDVMEIDDFGGVEDDDMLGAD
ncbi:hypothetical protein LTS18_010510, partial [Coniosporium uncinatum]